MKGKKFLFGKLLGKLGLFTPGLVLVMLGLSIGVYEVWPSGDRLSSLSYLLSTGITFLGLISIISSIPIAGLYTSSEMRRLTENVYGNIEKLKEAYEDDAVRYEESREIIIHTMSLLSELGFHEVRQQTKSFSSQEQTKSFSAQEIEHLNIVYRVVVELHAFKPEDYEKLAHLKRIGAVLSKLPLPERLEMIQTASEEEISFAEDQLGDTITIESDLPPGSPWLDIDETALDTSTTVSKSQTTAGESATSSQNTTELIKIAPDETVVEVAYATNRDKNDSAKAVSDKYGSETDTVKYGRAFVSIPAEHKDGHLERPSWYHLFGQTPGKHIMLRRLDELEHDAFFQKLKADIKGTENQRAFVFIHGFNTTFVEGVWRTAQIAYDLFGEERTEEGFKNLSVVPIYFSWPSKGEVTSYVHDGTRADRSAEILKTFLQDVSKTTGVKELTVIAHSMGNRVLARALTRVGDQMREKDGPVIKEIIMAAPDIDAEVFKNLSTAIEKTGDRITLYASDNDLALKASKVANGYRRLGDAGDEITVLENGDTIDASHLGEDMFAHTYVAEKPMLDDIHGIILKNETPDARRWLDKVRLKDSIYWEFKRT